jgi:hypothetical protein
MRRIQEKVKDLVEIRSYKSLQDFTADPSQTLAVYHFTDFTADLMAKWLDKVIEVDSQGGFTKALAGYRGVGKSHFLATLGAIVSHPELRSRITDGYVSASAQRLKRKHYPVGYVRRGTHSTLIDEIKDAIVQTFGVDFHSLPDSLTELMEFAATTADELPFVMMVDTAFDRVSKVSRDDGDLLGELAELAKRLNIFVGVALDDDIAGADGVNASIARNYAIDYLDQEHLYKIIETHLFPKYRQTQHLLHEIYTGFRELMPNFRWSEQRFTSLFPLHPTILEVAPFIRLYDQNFVILEFASEAGAKVLGRPANSLVALDEVFDTVENSLRKAEDLQDAFAAYDKLNTEIIANIPVMQRLQAKLVLKALLLLSLDSDGTTASEISAAMLIYNETDSASSIQSVEDLLESFVSGYPGQVHCIAEEGRETRYGLKVSGKDNLNQALAEAAIGVSAEVDEKILRRFARERFSDWTLQIEDEMPTVDSTDCQAVWRGGFRRGRVVWNWERRGGAETLIGSDRPSDFLEWEVIVCHPEFRDNLDLSKAEIPTVIWQPAPLKPEEEATLRRYHVLLTDSGLRETYGDQVRAVGHASQSAMEKIWRRIFLEDSKLIIDGFQHPFSEEAKFSGTLSEMFSQMLSSLFEFRYQQHPTFTKNLGMSEVSQIVSEHFSGARQNTPEIQELAEIYALPLGLVIPHENGFILETDDRLKQQPFARQVMALIDEKQGETVSLKKVYQALKAEPFGLVREAQHLVLAALVAQRCLEFVTSKGDRINRRSLDLKIIWDDIVGVATPSTHLYGSKELSNWAKTLTGVDTFQTIDNPTDCELILQALQDWLNDWKATRILERFDELSDECLNTKVWKLARHAQKTFGLVSITVESVLSRAISLEEGLQRIADAFSDSEEEFFECTSSLVVLEDFINGLGRRKRIWEYLAVCESTQDAHIEHLHHQLLQTIDAVTENPSESLNQELENTWQSFFVHYSEHFAVKHDTIMKSHLLQEKFDEVMRSDEWWEFENLSHLPIFHSHYWREAQKLCWQFKELDCGFDVREMLKVHPFCACSFRLSQYSEWEKLPNKLTQVVVEGRQSYRQTLSILRETITPMLESFIESEKDNEFVSAASNLLETLSNRDEISLLSNAELIVLGKIIQGMSVSPMLQVKLPPEAGFQSREELRNQLTVWLNELPSEPCLLKI